MKYTIFVICYLLFFSSTAFAQKPTIELIQATCNMVGQIAEVSMTHRQNGTSLKNVLKNRPKGDTIIKEIATEAYRYPIFQTQRQKQETINKFTKDAVISCYKSFQ